jgi:hypothetical protein
MHGPKFTFAASIMPDGASAHVGLGALPNHTCPSVIVQVPIRVDYEATPVGRELIENCQPFWTWALWEGRGIRGGSRDLRFEPTASRYRLLAFFQELHKRAPSMWHSTRKSLGSLPGPIRSRRIALKGDCSVSLGEYRGCSGLLRIRSGQGAYRRTEFTPIRPENRGFSDNDGNREQY